ncbi:MAG: response regulator [Prevotellaceae bacterium]|jgi:signal transduction histidine kinase/DNA-binding response OmpR family regulator/ligand-binding sensor domain-containing protein|nr:response regulator [Prevotellaceae bacterium]
MKNFKIKQIYLFLFLFLIPIKINAQSALPMCHFAHYGTDNGLPQNTVMSILQDSKGFMWFSTWNGLCKFDGYDFKTFKIQSGDDYPMRSNRMDFLCEDIYGKIWVQSYDNEAHRFDPKTERFTSIRAVNGYENLTFKVNEIKPMQSGRVWLLSHENGAVCVKDSDFSVEFYNRENNKLLSNKVLSAYEDKNKNTWILTDNGLANIQNKSEKISYYFSENSANSVRQAFFAVCETDSELWFGSSNGNVWRYGKRTGQFKLVDFQCDSKIFQIRKIDDENMLIVSSADGFFIFNIKNNAKEHFITSDATACSNEIFNSYIDRRKHIWLETNCLGVVKFDFASKTFKHFTPKIESQVLTVFEPNFIIFEDKNDRLWVHPRGGGFSYYSPENDVLMPFFNEPGAANFQFSNILHAAFSDRQGNLWLSTRSHGLEKAIFDNNLFQTFVLESKMQSTVNNDVRAIFQDRKGQIWVSVRSGKIFVLDSDLRIQGYLTADGKIDTGTPLRGIAYCIMQDKTGNIWIGTKGDGVYKIAENKQITHFIDNQNGIYGLSNNNIYSIFQDRNGRIWIGTYGGGLNLYDAENDRFINHRNNLKQYPIQTGAQIRTIGQDKFGNILAGTTIGLIGFQADFTQPEKIDFKVFTRLSANKNSIGGNDIFDICTTKAGQTYIATFGGGVSEIIETDSDGLPLKFRNYTTQNGLPSDVILSIVEAENGELWVCSENSLTKFAPKNETFEMFGEVRRMLNRLSFSESSKCVMKNGEILLGFSQGIIRFDPKNVVQNLYKPYLAFTDFKIFNKSVEIGAKDSPLPSAVDDVQKIVLNHNQNFFTVEFVALDYTDPGNIYYAYKMDDFDPGWNYVVNQRAANYTKLSRGTYTFRVKSTNSDGVWTDNERVLKIVIRPPFWNTIWAYIVYAVLTIVLTYTLLRIVFNYYKMKAGIDLEHQQTEMKARFFTDISHEIRTPLTMIVSPIENIIQEKSTPKNIRTQLELVQKNAQKMLAMVNQILDFRKIQKTELNVQEIEIGNFVSAICNDFAETYDQKRRHFTITNSVGNAKIWADKSGIEKIIVNLLSNAFKYTSENRNIEVNIFEKNKDEIAVEVRDEGFGIDREKIGRLFKRFESFNEDKSKPSTGIGLSLVKEIADKHCAKVQVDSKLGEGSAFTVLFQKGFKHFEDKVNILPAECGQSAESPEITGAESIELHEKTTILIVEDDADLRSFIRSILENEYTVFEAADGEEGYRKSVEILPDLVVSDIMMPKMDGIKFLQKLRTNVTTSHILFVLLTAKTTLENQLEGLRKGADDYITKPFNANLLLAKIQTMLERQRNLQRYYQNYFNLNKDKKQAFELQQLTISKQDEKLMRKVVEVIKNNIDNSEFRIDDICAEVGMSRTVFYKKIKNLTGLAPVEFVRDIMLQYAAQILETEDIAIKEVSYSIGIADTKYFTKIFKEKYSLTPTEYRKKRRQQQN